MGDVKVLRIPSPDMQRERNRMTFTPSCVSPLERLQDMRTHPKGPTRFSVFCFSSHVISIPGRTRGGLLFTHHGIEAIIRAIPFYMIFSIYYISASVHQEALLLSLGTCCTIGTLVAHQRCK
jgi:hypothetical protein